MPQLSRWNATLLLIVLAIFMLWGVLAGQAVREAPAVIDPAQSDLYLYKTIVEAMDKGDSYYRAAIDAQLAGGYPVQPAPTVRLPTTATLISITGERTAFVLLAVLLGSAILASIRSFDLVSSTRRQWIGSSFLLVLAMAIFGPPAIYFQETWAVLFLLLSLASRRSSLTLAVSFAVLAFAFRELSILFILSMGIHEMLHRRTKAVCFWASAACMCTIAYFGHAWAAEQALQGISVDSQTASPGWLVFGGWPFIVGSVRSVTMLSLTPLFVSALVVPLALVGWVLNARTEDAERFTFAVLGFILPFMLIGRPNNDYWALLYAALLLPGLAFSWQALKLLVSAALMSSHPDKQDSI